MPKYPANNASAPGSLDVGGEYAVYMMAKPPERLWEQAFPPGLADFCVAKTLTPRRSPPIRPRFLKMDVNLNPRAAPSKGLTDGSGMEEDFARCPGAAN